MVLFKKVKKYAIKEYHKYYNHNYYNMYTLFYTKLLKLLFKNNYFNKENKV